MAHVRSSSLRRFSLSVLAGTCLLALAGCRPFHDMVRSRSVEAEPETAATNEVDEVLDVKSPERAPFFKNTRLSGAMSDEGRDIERSLGIR